MHSPLNKRLPRELRNNLGKYLGIFLLMAIAIAMTSGFLVAASSIQKITEEVPETYHVEDGRFATAFEADDATLAAVEELGCTVYPSFSCDLPLFVPTSDDELTVRLIKNRTDVNLAVYAEGEAPASSDEIALDRAFCANNGLSVGDEVKVAGKSFVISGIMTLPDDVASFMNNSDLVFNELTLAYAQVTPEAYDDLAAGGSIFTYSFVLDDRDMSLPDRVSFEEDVAETLADHGAVVTDLVDKDANQGITYAADDVKGDQVMWQVLLVMLIVIMGFVFVVLTNATIESESAIIGTLLASGYRKREILRHYLVLPVAVGLLGCAMGNLIGRVLLSDPMKGLYYNSYNLPPYVASWSTRVFVMTTVVPFAVLVGITIIGLLARLRLTPLQFLRHELGHAARGGVRLPDALGFVTRFRLRVFLRNWSHFLTLFFGIAFGSLLLVFSFCLMPTMTHYADARAADIAASHIYVLKAPLELDGTPSEREAYEAAETLATTEDLTSIAPERLLAMMLQAQTVDADAHAVNTRENDPDAIAQVEKVTMGSLQAPRVLSDSNEEVTVYGISEESRYWTDVDVSNGRAVAGAGLARKCGVKAGEDHEFFDKYSGKTHTIHIDAVNDSVTDMSLYLPIGACNDLFDEDAGYFNAYASDAALDVNPRYLSSEITPESMDAIVDQMQNSMGSIARVIGLVALPIYLILIYLLTKTVIDRSARAISYMKVFGYEDREISRLYVRSITVTVVASIILALPLIIWALGGILDVAMASYDGYMQAYVPAKSFIEEIALGIATYAVVAFFHIRRIRRVSLSLAMKAQE
ncbi:FtsX-like permease family protein [uncultured Slackia sp.]|uniref:ABC transporter permease n=1 Tax=uncultured Slackia sp. TaxID=665903 RepID=UPI002804ECF2|nr:FtsX-like permease family protein [uncultured Slackia sp.]